MNEKIASAFAKVSTKAVKHTPEIAMGAGIVGVVTSAVLIGKASTHISEPLDKFNDMHEKIEYVWSITDENGNVKGKEKNYTKKDYMSDKTIAYRDLTFDMIKLYALPVGVGVAGIGAILYSHNLLRAREATAAAAAAFMAESFDKYRDNVRRDLGEDADRAFYEGREVKVNKEGEVKTAKKSNPDHDTRIKALFDEVNARSTWERTPGLNYIRVNTVQKMMNDRLTSRGHLFLNEVFDELGLPRTKEGAIIGWIKDFEHESYVDFGLGHTENREILDFVNGDEPSVWLTFNCDGLIWDRI